MAAAATVVEVTAAILPLPVAMVAIPPHLLDTEVVLLHLVVTVAQWALAEAVVTEVAMAAMEVAEAAALAMVATLVTAVEVVHVTMVTTATVVTAGEVEIMGKF